MTAESYKYTGRALDKRIAKDLIPELFAGKQGSLQEIYEAVHEHHTKLGGMPAVAKNPVKSTCGKALADLHSQGAADSPGKSGPGGVWTVHFKPAPTPEPTREKPTTGGIEPLETLYDEPGRAESCYAYYYPAYRELAELRGDDRWPIKFGKTEDGDSAAARVFGQTSSTNICERPVFEIEVKCDSADLYEKVIHKMLKNRGLHMKDAPGKEWFMTNPDELKGLIEDFEGRPSQ